MSYQIDQSGKIEQTSKPTVIAVSNGKHLSVWISAKEKRKIEKMFRQANKPNIFIYMTFAILTYLLVKSELRHMDILCLDREYKGYEPLIKKYLIEVIRRSGYKDIPTIYFTEIGKKSAAHKLAIKTYRKQLKPTQIVTAQDLVKWIL